MQMNNGKKMPLMLKRNTKLSGIINSTRFHHNVWSLLHNLAIVKQVLTTKAKMKNE